MAELYKYPKYYIFLLFFNLLAIIPKTVPLENSLSFNYRNFADTSNITLESAVTENQSIRLAGPGVIAGRATYFEPMKLWDNSTGRVADFTTRFTFMIDSDNATEYADGMTFFLAREGLRLNSTATYGDSLGIAVDAQRLKATKENSYIAVEFDIYSNNYDPVGAHVGIDINSMRSIATVTWLCNVREGKMNEALVVYNSTTQVLSVNFTGFRGDAVVWQFLSHRVDLKSLLPEEVIFGFSAGTGYWTAVHSLLSWDFRSTLEVSDDQPSSVPPSGQNKINLLRLGLGLGFGTVFLFLVCLVLYCSGLCNKIFRRGKGEVRMSDNELDEEFQRGSGPKKFSVNEVALATGNFKDDFKLGQGGFGSVYKGVLNGQNVAVKRMLKGLSEGLKEYKTEVNVIGQLRHKNLVKLIGWSHKKTDLLLLYEYMPNGSLYSHLFEQNHNLLICEQRYKIARGLGTGLRYLHEEVKPCVLHRDVKSSNVLLDSDFEAKLGDFGLAKLMDHSKEAQTVTNAAGTLGYRAPEYANALNCKASKETDVYSYGVVCLELACGRKAIECNAPEDQREIVRWVWDLYGKGKIIEAADQRLSDGSDFDPRQMERLMVVGLWCAHPDYSQRPSMSRALQVLDSKNNELPSLPLKMPVYTHVSRDFRTPPSSISRNGSEGH